MIPLLKYVFLELFLELVSCWLMLYSGCNIRFVWRLHILHNQIFKDCHCVPFDKKLASLTNYREKQSFPMASCFVILERGKMRLATIPGFLTNACLKNQTALTNQTKGRQAKPAKKYFRQRLSRSASLTFGLDRSMLRFFSASLCLDHF